MKKILFIPILTSLLVVGFFISCDLNAPSTELAISQDFMTHVSEVSFVTDISDATSGIIIEDLDGTKSKVTISGPGADKVFNIEGKKEFVIQGGSLQLLLDPSATFDSTSNTVEVNVIVEADGFLTRNIPVTFVKDQNNSSQKIAMVKKSKLPSGINIATNNSGVISATAGLDRAIKLTASNASTNGVTTEVTIPAGIKMKDSNGNVLSGDLKIEVVSFSEGNGGTAYFPGGLIPKDVKLADGSISKIGAFYSAGFTTINMTVGSKTVRTFEGAKVAVKMNLSKENFNAETGKAYKVGDNLDIWSYENDNGQWKFESHGTVKADTNGGLYAEFETSHLSSFNFDAYFPIHNDCKATLTVKVNSTSTIYGNLKISYINDLGKEQLLNTLSTQIYNGSTDELRNIPDFIRVKLEYFDPNTPNTPLFSKIYEKKALCGVIPITIDLPTNKMPIFMSYRATCPNSNITVYPPIGTYVDFKNVGETYYRRLFTVDYYMRSKDIIEIPQWMRGGTFEFRVTSGTKIATKTLTLTADNNFIPVDLPTSVCNSLK